MAHFDVPRNIPHAATVVLRIQKRLAPVLARPEAKDLALDLGLLVATVCDYEWDDDPPEAEALRVAEEASILARRVVAEIERLGLQEDRLGQSIRNLFECLGLGEEGAQISLRAGEDPRSLMRPV